MNELKVFSSSEFGELGVMLIDGKEYFPATQCAVLLGYKNPQEAIREKCKGVRKTLTPTNGGTQAVNYIARTATAVVSEVMKQILPMISGTDIQTVTEIDTTEYIYKGPTKCIIETLDENLRAQVDKMIKSGRYSYQGIADFLRDNGIKISFASVRNYALRHCGITKRSRTVSLQVSLDELKED